MNKEDILIVCALEEETDGKLDGWNAEEFVRKTVKSYSFEINGKVKKVMSHDELFNLFSTLLLRPFAIENRHKGQKDHTNLGISSFFARFSCQSTLANNSLSA